MGKKSRRNRGNDAQQRKTEKKMVVKPLTGSTQNLANMIFYPEVALEESATPSGASVRGTVGHNAMFEVGLHIFEKRMQTAWQKSRVVFEEFTPLLLALQDAGIAQNRDESWRVDSATICDSEERLRLQLSDLEQRLEGGEESFLYIPLEAFYCNLSHELIGVMMKKMGVPPNMWANVMKGYNEEVQVWTHKKGPCIDLARPPDEDLVGPHPFKRGLRLQAGMTPTIAAIILYGMMKIAGISSSPDDVFIFPQALVFASKDADKKIDETLQKIGSFTPCIYDRQDLWSTAGKHTPVKLMELAPNPDAVESGIPFILQPGDEPVSHVENEQFMQAVKEDGCCWYPLFSDDPGSNLCE